MAIVGGIVVIHIATFLYWLIQRTVCLLAFVAIVLGVFEWQGWNLWLAVAIVGLVVLFANGPPEGWRTVKKTKEKP